MQLLLQNQKTDLLANSHNVGSLASRVYNKNNRQQADPNGANQSNLWVDKSSDKNVHVWCRNIEKSISTSGKKPSLITPDEPMMNLGRMTTEPCVLSRPSTGEIASGQTDKIDELCFRPTGVACEKQLKDVEGHTIRVMASASAEGPCVTCF